MNGEAGQKIGGETMRKSMPSLPLLWRATCDSTAARHPRMPRSSGNDLSTTFPHREEICQRPIGWIHR